MPHLRTVIVHIVDPKYEAHLLYPEFLDLRKYDSNRETRSQTSGNLRICGQRMERPDKDQHQHHHSTPKKNAT